MTPEKRRAYESARHQKRTALIGAVIYCIGALTAILFVIYVGEYLL
jgi:hypothetical protein